MNSQKHYAAGIGAFVIWGFFSLPLRALKEFSAGDILFFRILLSAVLLLIILSAFRKKQVLKEYRNFRALSRLQRKQVIQLTLIGAILLTFNWLVFIYIVNNVNVKTASFSYLICPVITAVMGSVLLKEQLAPLQWLAVALCALSCMLIGMNSLEELGLSFATALSYGLYLISQRKNQGFDRLVVLAVQVLFSLLILSLGFSQLVTAVPTVPYFYGVIFLISAGFTILPLFLNLYALNKVNSATIGILMYINPLLNFVLAILVFDEHVNLMQMLGYSLILLGLVIFNYQNFKKLQTSMARAKG